MIKIGELKRSIEELPDEYRAVVLDNLIGDKSLWVETDDTRELGEVSGKPHTIEEVIGYLKESENTPRLRGSLLYANYDELNAFYLTEQVGLDVCSFDVVIEYCDGVVLEECINRYADSETYPMIHTTAVSESNSDKYVPIPGWIHEKYQKIEIILSPYFKATFQYINLVDKITGEKRPDSYKIETRVKPPCNHEVLGNFCNYSYEDEMHAIIDGLDKLEEMGIYINRPETKFHSVELNLTFHMDCEFSELKRPLQYYQLYIDARYVNSLYVYNGKKRIEFSWNDPEEKYAKMKLSGMQSKSKNISVTLYDKAYETIFSARYNKEPSQSIFFEKYVRKPKSLVRLEFRLTGKSAIKEYLGEIKIADIDQNTLVAAYKKLVEHYFVEPYEKYYEDSSKKLKTLFKKMADEHIVRKGNRWDNWLLNEIRAEEISSQSTPMCLESSDMEEFFWKVPAFAHDKNKYRKKIFELLDTANIFKKNYKNSYSILGNFFLKTWYLKGLSDKRRIGYSVDVAFDEIIKMMEKDTDYTNTFNAINRELTSDRILEKIEDGRKFDEYLEHLDAEKVKQILDNVNYIRAILEDYGNGKYITLHKDREYEKIYRTFKGFLEELHDYFEENESEITEQFPELEYIVDELDELINDMETINENINKSYE